MTYSDDELRAIVNSHPYDTRPQERDLAAALLQERENCERRIEAVGRSEVMRVEAALAIAEKAEAALDRVEALCDSLYWKQGDPVPADMIVKMIKKAIKGDS